VPVFIPKQLLAAGLAAAPLFAASYYPVRLDDPQAVYVSPGGDDSTAAIQRAIDKVQETTKYGIVFFAGGRYRITHPLLIWPGIRLIGYGSTRPVLVLAPHSPGYQDAARENYLVFFAGRRPANLAPGQLPPDANPGTFYSAVSNIDIEIGEGNAGAVGVRGTYAQHCFLAHMDFHMGSGLAGVHNTGNVMEDVHFHGGRYGIWTHTPSPGWQFTAVDASFEGQREAAIRDEQAGLTLIRPDFRHVPAAITIDAGSPDELWIKDGRIEDVSGPAVVISLEHNPRTEINIENVVCRGVPIFALLRESGKRFSAPAASYRVSSFNHGLAYADLGSPGEIRDTFDAAPLASLAAPVLSDLTPLPPADTWVNVHTLGVKGDGVTDDTAALRAAIASHRALYLPSGNYILSDTITLRPDTVLIGLHPLATELVLRDRAAAFQGPGTPKPLIEAPSGGANIVMGLGLYTNGINSRAVAALWMSGPQSLMNDVRFLGGHGTVDLQGKRINPYNNTHTADPDLNRRWDSQYPSLWITHGGGGTFFDIWTPSTFAQAGVMISDTTTEGRVYELSSEHHVRHEVQIRNASHWSIYALQTEEERGEGPFALPLEIESSHDITIANFHLYRVISSYQPFPYAVEVSNSSGIRFRNFHCYSNSKVAFDDAVYDRTHDVELRQREFASLDLTGKPRSPRPHRATAVFAADAKVEKLAGGFFNISGGAASASGDFYFVDAHWQRIYKWAAASRQLTTVSDSPLEPVNLAFDKSGNLLVVSYAGAGTIYSFHPGASPDQFRFLKPVPAKPRPGLTAVLPAGDWRLSRDSQTGAPVPKRYQYVSLDGSTFVPAGEDFVRGAENWGVKSADLLRAFGLAPASPNAPFYFTSEAEMMTWRGHVSPDGNLTDLQLFLNRGGESAATDSRGNVYLAAGEIFVYDPSGRLIDTINTPERPIQLVFGGPDRRTLFIAARTSLYAIRALIPGR
jgi:hypothetical protein